MYTRNVWGAVLCVRCWSLFGADLSHRYPVEVLPWCSEELSHTHLVKKKKGGKKGKEKPTAGHTLCRISPICNVLQHWCCFHEAHQYLWYIKKWPGGTFSLYDMHQIRHWPQLWQSVWVIYYWANCCENLLVIFRDEKSWSLFWMLKELPFLCSSLLLLFKESKQPELRGAFVCIFWRSEWKQRWERGWGVGTYSYRRIFAAHRCRWSGKRLVPSHLGWLCKAGCNQRGRAATHPSPSQQGLKISF